MDDATDRAALANARANIYRFLASAFLTSPTDALLARVRDTDLRAAFADWMNGAEWQVIATSPLDALVVEYNRIFVVPGNGYVPPFESVYTDTIEIEYSPHQVSGAGALCVAPRGGRVFLGRSQ